MHGVALTKRNDTGAPWSVTDDDNRRQRASLVWPATPYVGGPVIIHKAWNAQYEPVCLTQIPHV